MSRTRRIPVLGGMNAHICTESFDFFSFSLLYFAVVLQVSALYRETLRFLMNLACCQWVAFFLYSCFGRPGFFQGTENTSCHDPTALYRCCCANVSRPSIPINTILADTASALYWFSFLPTGHRHLIIAVASCASVVAPLFFSGLRQLGRSLCAVLSWFRLCVESWLSF